jgi:predicted nuclease with TOPRIM domain
MRARADEPTDELRSEYDFASMKDGVRGKYAKQYSGGTNLVLLAPDVAEVFRDGNSVNEALRGLIGIARAKVPRKRPGSSKRAVATS